MALWSLMELIDRQHIEKGEKRLALALKHEDYPREANWVQLLAGEIEARTNRQVLLESNYWSSWDGVGASDRGWPRVDLWVPGGDNLPPLYAELKIAQVHQKSSKIGNESARKILVSWADDLWRLLTGPFQKNDVAPVHCSFVVYAWGEGSIRPRSSAVKETDGTAINADQVHENLLNASDIEGFLEKLPSSFSVSVTSKEGASVQALIIEWVQRRRAKSDYVKDWSGRTR